MKQHKHEATFSGLLLLLLLFLRYVYTAGHMGNEDGKFGDKCNSTSECGFAGSVCNQDSKTCLCRPEFTATNHLNKCGFLAKINESCFFNEQCENLNHLTECRNNVCSCRYQKVPVLKDDGDIECTDVKTTYTPERYVDPAMIGILVAMFLMFITICVVLRLFSKARWRENRTIFNTPNPRLMNASLLRDSKLAHHDRRGSKTSKASGDASRPARRTESRLSDNVDEAPAKTESNTNVAVEIQVQKA
ncbi:uncharacterized protein LOC132700703 isoform X2 [Cylas formicarius]|uniref:uncharacterized protein LOC132700703 isoform X2 n=1 Tax=Cylas formicarius TaxID=197179 RepID=UPI002958AB26|nr:uncharacterized protein LOC132700703 isoform X2 [Cylas formicarius]